MNRSSSPLVAYQPLLRRTGFLAAISLVLAFALVAYLFGVQDQFFSRLFRAFFVFFWLLAVTFFGVVPFVQWAAGSWFGKAWADAPQQPARRPRPVTPSTRKPTRTATRLDSTNHP
ncbi:hypothetical protein SAMN06269173_102596 [Hymenobacter mucosus]|uniref:Uncharacterized protein n=1 Tax=Hymenobacter mucosus TaxID=1411120 RepID=A0A238WH52_9BACT|nr:hypothetical protein SAMN06269173_102596 [Hymenobacter mucosus]